MSEFFNVSLTSMFNTSPNSYGLLHPSASMPVARLVEAHAIVGLPVATGEAGLEQEIGELVEQRLEIDRVGHLRRELAVGMEAHGDSPRGEIPPRAPKCQWAKPWANRDAALFFGRALSNIHQPVPRLSPPSELSPISHWPDALADRHLDAVHGTGLAHAGVDEQRLSRRAGRDDVVRTDPDFHDARRRDGGPFGQAPARTHCAERLSRQRDAALAVSYTHLRAHETRH